MIAPFRSVRVRLTLGYVTFLAVVLLGYSAGIVIALREWFQQDMDLRLARDARRARDIIEPDEQGTFRFNETDKDAEKPFDRDPKIDAWDDRGASIPGSPWLGADEIRRFPDLVRTGAESVVLGDGIWSRYLVETCEIAGRPVTIRVVRSEEALHRRISKLITVMTWAAPVAIVLAGAAGYFMARRALRPVGAMAARAREITAERLSDRLPAGNPRDELGKLAQVLNELMARLDRSFENLRRFTADASHELRTPLTALRIVGEVGLREHRDAKAYRDVISSMLEEADRLARLVDALLVLTRADSGQVRVEHVPVDLVATVRAVADQLGVLAEENLVSLEIETPTEAQVLGDSVFLRQVVSNLVDNAIKYSARGSKVRLEVRVEGTRVHFAVEDSGPGIAPEHQARIFDRFYRIDAGRTRAAGGHGLGLAITKWIVESLGGTISVTSTPPHGATFLVQLVACGKNGDKNVADP